MLRGARDHDRAAAGRIAKGKDVLIRLHVERAAVGEDGDAQGVGDGAHNLHLRGRDGFARALRRHPAVDRQRSDAWGWVGEGIRNRGMREKTNTTER